MKNGKSAFCILNDNMKIPLGNVVKAQKTLI
jgi:hypothetical protein